MGRCRTARPTDSDFPNGLEICSAPFTVRVQSIYQSTQNEEHNAVLRAAAQELRQFLQGCGGTGHPILACPDTAEQQALQVAKKQRFCSAEQLAVALESCFPGADWQIFVCKYGLKVKASTLFETLKAMNNKMFEVQNCLGKKSCGLWVPSPAVREDLCGGTS